MDDNEKKKFQLKIGGLVIGKKTIIVVVGLVLLIFITSWYNNYKDEKEYERYLEEQAIAEQNKANTPTTEPYDADKALQQSLVKKFGEPPEGFEWDVLGNLVAIGNDEGSTCEDVVYTFVRALSILDFSTAERYSSDSRIVATYQDYYSEISNDIIDYYDNFLRKQYKLSLTSLEVNGVSDIAVFADGTQYVTLNVSVLDLTDKDFWRNDTEALFNQLCVYKETEGDGVKVKQYVYDYIYSKYEDGTIQKKNHNIELVVSKANGSGWLVTGDGELNAVLEYTNGVDVADYILSSFEDWYLDYSLSKIGG